MAGNWFEKPVRRNRATPTRRPNAFTPGLVRLEDRTVPTVFSNTTSIAVPADTGVGAGDASPYPSKIEATGLVGVVRTVTVTLNNLSHASVPDVDVLLVGPTGKAVVLMSDIGTTGDAVSGVTLTFDDAAASSLAFPFGNGTFKATNVGTGDPFTGYAGTPGTDLAVFKNTDGNGFWELRVVDDGAGDVGTIAGGWSIDIVSKVNAPPVANNDAYTVDEDAILTVSAADGVLNNAAGKDTDADGDPLTAVLVTGPSSGKLNLAADGSFVYTPNANFFGADSFTYTANDGITNGNTATVTFTVTGKDDAPVAVNDRYVVQQDKVLSPDAFTGVISNDRHPDNVIFRATLLEENFEGFSLTQYLGTAGTSPQDPNGKDWTAELPGGWTKTVERIGGSTPLDPSPAEFRGWAIHNIDSWIGVQGNQGRTGFTRGGVGKGGSVFVADGDAYDDGPETADAGGPVAYRFDFSPRPISLRGVLANTLKLEFDSSFFPENNQKGFVSISFDGGATFADLLVLDTAYAGGNNDNPSKLNERISLAVNNPGDKDSALLRFRYEGANNWWWGIDNLAITGDRTLRSELTASLVGGTSSGVLNLAADGSFTYTPNAGFTGTDTFTYKLSDGVGSSNTATVSIDVRSNNPAAPLAVADKYAVLINNQLKVIDNAGVLANDADADGDPLTAILVTGPSKGTVALAADGSFVYTPNTNFAGTDTFTYKANDGFTDSPTATVTITVVSNAPVITSNGGGDEGAVSVPENSSAVITTVTATDADAGQTVTYSLNGGADKARFAIDPASGQVTWVSPPNFEVPTDLNEDNVYVVQVRATDDSGAFDTQTLSVTVTDVAETTEIVSGGGGPTATVGVIEHNFGVTTVKAIPSAGVTYSITGGADQARFAIDGSTGVLTFVASPDFERPADANSDNVYEVTVKASDGTNSDTQALSVFVLNYDGEPGVFDDAFTTLKNTQLTVAAPGVQGNDSTRLSLLAETFEGFTLKPFRSPTETGGDGTDWSPELPLGWDRKSTNIAGDVTLVGDPVEFRGWNILDADSWNATAGQGRSNFTRGGAGKHGSVFVADGDEFDDGAGNGGSYKFVVTTRPVSLTGTAANSAKLEFDSSFFPENDQKGLVQVSFDGGTTFADLLVLDTAYAGGNNNNSSKLNERIVLSLNNPAGKDSALVRFTYTGGNNWWWAIDNVLVTADRDGATAPNAVLVAGPASGTLNSFNADGSFVYTPNAGFAGVDTFTYRINDGVDSQVATVSINVARAETVTWTGTTDGVWDVNTTANWKLPDGTSTTFQVGDSARFDGTAVGAKTITLSVPVGVGSGGVLVDTSGTYTIQGTGSIQGTGGLIVTGGGTLILATDNTFTGGSTIGAGSTLQLGSGGGTGSVVGDVTNNGTLIFNRTGTTTFNGAIAGTGGVKQTVDTVNLLAANTYQGGTAIAGGTVGLGTGTSLGTGNVTFTGTGAAGLYFLSSDAVANGITLPAAVAAQRITLLTDVDAGVGKTPSLTGKITGGSDMLTLFLNLDASNNSGGVTFANAANDFRASKLQLNRGRVGIAANGAFGNSANLIFLDVTRSGAGQEGTGLHFLAPGINVPNPVQFGDYANINVNGFDATLSGNITGTSGSTSQPYTVTGGTLTGGDAAGSLRLTGTNSFYHALQVFANTRLIAASATALGNADRGTAVDAGATLVFDNFGTYANAEALTLNGTGTQSGGIGQGALQNLAGANTFTGPIALGSNSRVTVSAGSLSLGGVISGGFDLETTGPGVLTLGGVNAYTGATAVNAGTLLVNGSIATSSKVTVADGATLGGTGAAPAAVVSGKLAPGVGATGKLNIGNLSFGTAGARQLLVDLLGVDVGSGYDQVNVTGSVDLTGATLIGAGGFTPPAGAKLVIVANDGSDAVVGTFAGLAEGAAVGINGYQYTISYAGGDGNDVVLTATGTFAAPQVELVDINNGSAQRSRVTQITVTFDSPVDLAAGAFVLTGTSPTGASLTAVTVAFTTQLVNGRTVATLTFSGADTEFGSLKDGVWVLRVVASQVTRSGTTTQMTSDFLTPSTGPGRITRFFGDSDGDGDVDVLDLGQFRQAYGRTAGQPGYAAHFDFDVDGDIDVLDLGRFRQRYGRTL